MSSYTDIWNSPGEVFNGEDYAVIARSFLFEIGILSRTLEP
jgi:hypothetical protein